MMMGAVQAHLTDYSRLFSQKCILRINFSVHNRILTVIGVVRCREGRCTETVRRIVSQSRQYTPTALVFGCKHAYHLAFVCFVPEDILRCVTRAQSRVTIVCRRESTQVSVWNCTTCLCNVFTCGISSHTLGLSLAVCAVQKGGFGSNQKARIA